VSGASRRQFSSDYPFDSSRNTAGFAQGLSLRSAQGISLRSAYGRQASSGNNLLNCSLFEELFLSFYFPLFYLIDENGVANDGDGLVGVEPVVKAGWLIETGDSDAAAALKESGRDGQPCILRQFGRVSLSPPGLVFSA